MNRMKNRHHKLFLEFFFPAHGWSVGPHTRVHSPVRRVGLKFRACGLCNQDLTCIAVTGWEFWVLEREIRRVLANRRGLCQMCSARYLSLSWLLVRTVGRDRLVCTTRGGGAIFYSGIGWRNFDVTTDWKILQGKFCIREILKCSFFFFNSGPPVMFH